MSPETDRSSRFGKSVFRTVTESLVRRDRTRHRLGMLVLASPIAMFGVLPMAVPVEDPVEQAEGVEVPVGEIVEPVTAPTSTIPEGCIVPIPVQATFVGIVVESDRRTARFSVEQMRGGSLEGYTSRNLVDVDYVEDVRFLELGESYIVAVGIDQASGRLYSKVRDPEPLLGSSQVIGLNTGAACPELEDAVRTVTMQGRAVDSGVLTPLREAQPRLIRSIVLPLVWALGILVALATLKAFATALLEASHRAWNGQPVVSRRKRRQW